MRQFFAGIPDAEAIEEDGAQDGATVTMRFIVQGTHTGDLWGLAPTHRVGRHHDLPPARWPGSQTMGSRRLDRNPPRGRRLHPALASLTR